MTDAGAAVEARERGDRPGDAFEGLLALVVAELVRLPAERIGQHVEAVLGRTAGFFGFDYSSVGQLDEASSLIRLTHQWHAAPLEGMPPVLAVELPGLAAGEILVLDGKRDFPPEAVRERELLARFGQRSMVGLPLVVGGLVIGGYFASTMERRPWSAEDLDRLRLLGDVLAGALARQSTELVLRRSIAENAELRGRLELESSSLRQEITESRFEEIVGRSEALRSALHKIDQVAATDAPVLLLGETGTGKELAARAIHDRSPRSRRPLITVNCAALPATLIESELFGHERGAFTGATHSRPGRFELADGGTLFLDEIGELDMTLQPKLLRVLQDGLVQRLGSTQSKKVDVRVIAASNRNLREEIREGRFRADLYYRLSVFPIELPTLRERREDIPLLVWYFVQARQRALGRTIDRIPAASMAALSAYDWPGNVRELQNVIERALILAKGPVLRIEDSALAGEPQAGATASGTERLDEAERSQILSVLERCHWMIEGGGQAAMRLGLAPSTLRNKMKKLGIARPQDRHPNRMPGPAKPVFTAGESAAEGAHRRLGEQQPGGPAERVLHHVRGLARDVGRFAGRPT